MSRSTIAPEIAVRLAAVDPAVTLLPEALAVTRQPGWQLADVRWTPGEGCRLAFRVEADGTPPTFIAMQVTPDGWSQHDYRDDPALRGIGHAIDPGTIAARLSTGEGEDSARWRVEPVRYRPRSRCVWRYMPAVQRVGISLYAKAFREADFETQRGLVDVLEPLRERRLVPGLVAVWPDLRVIVSSAVDGRSLSGVLADPDIGIAERLQALRRLGWLLGEFHARPAEDAPRFAAAQQLAAMAPAVEALRRIEPRLGDRVAIVLEALEGREPPRGRDVLGHGAFRAGQAIVAPNGELMLIDTDGVSRCDAARDLGRALAHLSWQAIRDRRLQPALRGGEQALLDGYIEHAAPVEPAALRWWRAAALVQLAARRFSRVEHDAWADVPQVVAEAEQLVSPIVRRRPRPAAADLLDTDVASALVRPVLAGDGASVGAIRVVSADRLATRSRRRVVVRYEVSGLPDSPSVAVIGKAFSDDDHAQRLHMNLRLLTDGPFGSSPNRVPRPLGLLRDHRLVLWMACDGVPLDRMTASADAEHGVRLAARWLAHLHASHVVLPRRFSLDEEAASTRHWATRIGDVDRRLGDRARGLARDWVTAVGTSEGAGADGPVPIHKDFHPGHVLIGRDTTVIDLDEARQGDPAFDVAHFRAYLQLLASRRAAGSAFDDAFIEEYAERSGWSERSSQRGYAAYAWLKIAKQWIAGSGPGRGGSRATRMAGAEDALARGERCLAA